MNTKLCTVTTTTNKNKEEGIEILKTLGLREDIRAENLTIEDFARLTNLFCQRAKK